MKRSEIIRELYLKLDNLGLGTDDSIIEESEFKQVTSTHAEEILTYLETLGMCPPAIKEPCETFVLHQGRYVKTEDSFIFTHKWDEE